MSNNQLLRQLLIDEEGFDTKAHQVQGIWHVGIGHNLEIDQTDDELAVIGDYDDPSQVQLTEAQAYELFDIDVDDAIEDIQPAFMPDELEALGETRRAVILSMAFQLGGGGIRKFKNFIKAVKVFDWQPASDEMLYANVETERRSAWYKQTPERCERAAFAMRHGYFEKYQETPVVSVNENATDLSETATIQLFEDAKDILQELARRCK